MATCIFFSNTNCWKTDSDFGMMVSGNCTPCLLAIQISTYNNNKIPIFVHSNALLISGSIPQTSGYIYA